MEEIKITEEKNPKKQSLALALILSLLVGIAGSVVWGLLYSTGWFVSLVAYVTSLGMFAVYLKFYKMGKLTFVWTLVWVILLNTLATFVSLVVTVAVEADVSMKESLDAIIESFNLIAGDLAIDLILGAVFGVLGVVSYYSFYKKQQKEKALQEEMKKQLLGNIEVKPEEKTEAIVEVAPESVEEKSIEKIKDEETKEVEPVAEKKQVTKTTAKRKKKINKTKKV